MGFARSKQPVIGVYLRALAVALLAGAGARAGCAAGAFARRKSRTWGSGAVNNVSTLVTGSDLTLN